MNHGRIEQVGTPEDVYHRPATPFVLGFLGEVNLFRARVDGRRAIVGNVALPLEGGGLGGEARGERADLYIRPHRLEVARAPRGGAEFRARVQRIHGVGPLGKLELLLDDGAAVRVELPSETLRELELAAGTVVWVTPREQHVFYADRPADAVNGSQEKALREV
jgi:sulfate transport system ATP-binding protein